MIYGKMNAWQLITLIFLQVLKQKLRERFPSQVFGFSPKIENTHGKKKV